MSTREQHVDLYGSFHVKAVEQIDSFTSAGEVLIFVFAHVLKFWLGQEG